MAPTALERAEAEREAVSLIIATIEPDALNHAVVPLTAPLVESYLQQCNDQLRAILDINSRILVLKPADPDPHKAEFTRIFRQVNLLQATLHGIKATFPTVSAGPSTGTPATKPDVRLPRLDLPVFTGNPMEWVSFRDMFITSIHSNATFSGTQKLSYLKSLVQGEPSRLINSIILCDANYDIAWKQLNERYQNGRELLFAIFNRFMSLPNLQSVSSAEIRNVVDSTRECLRCLEVLGIGREKGLDSFVLFLIFNKIDKESKKLWEQSQTGQNIPQLDDLFAFLENRARSLSAEGTSNQSSTQQQRPDTRKRTMANHSSDIRSSCKVCHANHYLYKCPKFSNMDQSTKSEMVKKLRLCYNCLQPGHSIGNCPSSSRCRTCNGKHHTLIHRETPKDSERVTNSTSNSSTNVPSGSRTESGNHVQDESPSSSMLATALVLVKDGNGQNQLCRAFLDGGATVSFITQSCQRRLGLKTSRTSTEILGLTSASVGNAKGMTSITFSSHFEPNSTFNVDTLILPKITGDLPMSEVDPSKWNHLQDLQFADPHFSNPKPIDILLGSDIFWNLLSNGRRSGCSGSPVAINSRLGWLVAGPTESKRVKTHQVCTVQTTHNNPLCINENPNADPSTCIHPMPHATSDTLKDDIELSPVVTVRLDAALRRFWELEALSSPKIVLREEKACEDHFKANYSRLHDGRFHVRLPFKRPTTDLGESHSMALRRLRHLEKRLSSNPMYQKEYSNFMKEYYSLGHMSLIENQTYSGPVSYLPHHFVLKADSTTTKFRVVFDASAKTSSGTSLNDIMMVGPVLQDNLVDIIMRFRCNPIAFTADIAKMYRQIRIPQEDAELQRILWRESPDKPVSIYRLDTVTYGTASAPYIATKILQQLSHDEANLYPLAAPVLERDFYVDDLMAGATDVESAKKVVSEVLKVTSGAQLSLRKWSTNSKELLASIPEDLRNSTTLKKHTTTLNSDQANSDDNSNESGLLKDMTNSLFSSDQSVKCLGILWNTEKDCFLFKVHLSHDPETIYTKRQVLSEIARLFDPLGWLAPVIITAKIFMQSLWKLQLDWDQPLPESMTQSWVDFKQDLEELSKLQIPRCVIPHTFSRLELHGFCDASEKAYSAVIYLYVYHETKQPVVSMISSKTRVAPTKTISLPKLELCGAHLLSQLLNDVKRALQQPISSIRAWTDSTVVLSWIKMCPSKLKTFVANRVTEITTNTSADLWYHIPGIHNPADCASRGISVQDLLSHHLWWKGPDSFQQQDCAIRKANPHLNQSSDRKSALTDEELVSLSREMKPVIVLSATPKSNLISTLIQRKSSFHSLLHLVGWIQRFINISRKRIPRNYGHLRVSELKEAERSIIKAVQASDFSEEISRLQTKQQLNPKSRLISLNPFIDQDGIMRVGGRLLNSSFSTNKKNPILLPRHSHLTDLVIINKHRELQHAGPQLTLAALQQQYWIVRGRDAIRFLLRKCVTCHRHRAQFLNQIMSDLPAARVTPNPPFHTCGVDYAGPFNLKTEAPRSKVTFKAYLCLFICFSTRAIHLEIASSLSTSAFLAALKRFVSRRNCPAAIYSDCGTNFIGAAKEMKELRSLVDSASFNNKISSAMSSKGIQWNFNPPSAPHFGGLWEAGVKSVKFHLHRVLGAARLTYEEMSTLICQIEACLNSRPLTPISSNPDDLEVLTPGHFLTGSPLTAVPEPNLMDLKTGRLDRWQLIQQMQQQFWSRWSNEYLSRLQQRPKWMQQRASPEVGDLALIKDERLPPQQWKLGRIIKLYHGADSNPRVADLKTVDGILKRPIVKLSLLPIEKGHVIPTDSL